MSKDTQTTEELKAIAIELSLLTGEVVTTVLTDYWQDEIHFKDGALLAEKSQSRFIFYPARPAWMTNGLHVSRDGGRITCDASRSPEAIAQDILRRLWPEALEYWQTCEKAQVKRDDEVKKVGAMVETLQAHGMKCSTWTGSETQKDLYSDHVRLNLSSSGIWEMKISNPTLEQSNKILEILGE
jgi:hypothetical protein